MKSIGKVLAGVAVAAALATSAHASVITVQGVTWDPDSAPPAGAADFQSTSNLNQWYQTSGAAYNPTGSVATFSVASDLVGTYVTGAGLFATLNGVNDSVTSPDTTPASFISGQLTYTFGGIFIKGVSSDNGVIKYTYDLSKSYFNVYSNNVANNYLQNGTLPAQANAADSNYATPFLTGIIDKFDVTALLLNVDTATGLGNLFGSSSGLISVTGGAAFENFDTNTKFDPVTGKYSDLSFTGSSQVDQGSKIGTVGTLNLSGNTIPEPESLALVGLGLLGLAASRRRKINN